MKDDLISRQAALDALEWKWAGKAAIDAIKNLPPTQSKIIRCKDCKHYLDGGCGNVDSQSPSKNLMGVKPDWYCADGERKD